MATKKKSGGKSGNLRSIRDLDEERALAAQSAADPGDGDEEDEDPPDEHHAEAAGDAGTKPKKKGFAREKREAHAEEAKAMLMQMLDVLGQGHAMGEVGKQMQTLVRSLLERAKLVGEANGTLTLTLSLEANEEAEVDVSYRSKITLPDRRGGKTVFYGLRGGDLSEEDPKQRSLPGLGRSDEVQGRTFLTDSSGSNPTPHN